MTDARLVDAFVAEAYAAFDNKQYDRAALWARIVGAALGSNAGLKVVAVSLHLLGQHDNAKRAYEQALAAFPDDLYLIAGMGELLTDSGDFDGAYPFLLRAIERDPKAEHPAGARARLVVVRLKRKLSL